MDRFKSWVVKTYGKKLLIWHVMLDESSTDTLNHKEDE